MRKLVAHHRPIAAARGGFTLIEMLVATTLVVMMMLMFAQIYIAAIGSLGEQQAIARNDGKARLADILLRADLRRASFQSTPGSNQGLLPLVNGDPVNQWQAGYFYLSENDQTNPTDDVLQFTTRISGNNRNPDPAAYFGRCQPVPGLNPGLFANHPELDDGDAANEVGASRAAEVSYFMRNGNLYRRVLLLRDVDLQAGGLSTPAQPSNTATLAEFAARVIPNSGTQDPSFYKAFDYAAYCRVINSADPTLDVARFMGTDSLENREDAIDCISRSMNRFGFATTPSNQTAALAFINSRGQPVEYDSLGNFFGRPVHAETGSYYWGWPGTRFNPLLDADLKYGFTKTDQLSYLPGNTPIADFETGNINYTRATEDLLLANVETFDVEVWDSGLVEFDPNGNGIVDLPAEDPRDLNSNGVYDVASGFVQLGHTGVTKSGVTTLTGDFRTAQRLNFDYGPGANPNEANPLGNPAPFPARNWVFDTGHPDMWSDNPYQTNAVVPARTSWYRPPYRPLQYRLSEDANQNGSLDSGEDLNGDNLLDSPKLPVRAGFLRVPSTAMSPQLYGTGAEDVNGNGALDSGEDLNGNGVLDQFANVVFRPFDTTQSIAYRCVIAGEVSEALSSEVAWPTVPGERVTDGTVTWEAFDNRIGLQKIRITIRLRDPIEGLPRQFSIIHSFANPK